MAPKFAAVGACQRGRNAAPAADTAPRVASAVARRQVTADAFQITRAVPATGDTAPRRAPTPNVAAAIAWRRGRRAVSTATKFVGAGACQRGHNAAPTAGTAPRAASAASMGASPQARLNAAATEIIALRTRAARLQATFFVGFVERTGRRGKC